jgi:DNA-directed RNA polymerase specialized sigma24 family protein
MNTERIIRAVEAASKAMCLWKYHVSDRSDLEQDAAVSVLCALEKADRMESPDGYLFVVARHRMVNMLREMSVSPEVDAGESTLARIDVLGERWSAAVRAEVERCGDLDVVGLVLLGEEKPAEAAKRLGMTTLTVYRRTCAAKRRMARNKKLQTLFRELA